MKRACWLSLLTMLWACSPSQAARGDANGPDAPLDAAPVFGDVQKVTDVIAPDGSQEVEPDQVAFEVAVDGVGPVDAVWDATENVAPQDSIEFPSDSSGDTVADLSPGDLQQLPPDLTDDGAQWVDVGVDEWIEECPEPCLQPASVCLQAVCVAGECTELPANDGMACDNSNLCTTNDVCQNGKCTPGSAVKCDDGDQCTVDSCEPQVGCLHEDPPNPCWPTPALVLRFPLWGAPFSQRIAMDGDLLYAVAQGSLRVFHNPTVLAGGGQPQLSRVFDFGATDIEAGADFAYLAGSNKFAVIDMDEPENPLVRGTIDLSLGVLRLEGHTVFGAGGNDFHVIDVTDPDAPAVVGTIAGIGPVANIAQKGTLLYLVGGGSLTSVDVTFPGLPAVKSEVSLGEEAYSVAVSEDVLYVGGRNAGQGTLWLLDISTPANPVLTATVNVTGMSSWGVMGLTVDGEYLYAQAWKSGTNFFVWDISTPASPTQVHSSNRPGSGGYDILVNDEMAWVTYGNAGLRAYDVANPAQPQATAVVSAALARSLSKIGAYLYFADSGPSYGVETGVISGLKIFDVSDIAAPVLKKNDGTSLKVPLEMKNDGKHLFIGDNSGGLKIIDVSADPQNTAATVLGGGARNSTALGSDSKLYVLRWPDKLETVDVSNFAAPALVATYQEPGIVHGQGEVTFRDGYLYIANYNLPFRVFAAANPLDLALVGSLELGGVANAVALRDDFGWVAMNSGEIRILDLKNPAQPTQVGIIAGPAGGSARRVEFGGNYGFVAFAQAGAGIYGITDPTQPELLGVIPADHQILDVEFDGTYLFLLEADNSLLAVGGF